MNQQTTRRTAWVDGPSVAWFLLSVIVTLFGLFLIVTQHSPWWIVVPGLIGVGIGYFSIWGFAAPKGK